jgi:hypothetical protein
MKMQILLSVFVLAVGLAGLCAIATVAGCSRTSPLGSHVAGPTVTPTPVAVFGLVIDDFEHPNRGKGITDPTNTADYINYYGGSNLTDYGPKQTPTKIVTPSYIFPYPNLDIVSPGSNLLGGTPGHCCHIYGMVGPNASNFYLPNAYPYAQAQLLFSQAVNVENISPARSFSFSYKCTLPAGANHYRFELLDKFTSTYSFWGYTLAPTADGNWHSVTVLFSALTPSFSPAGTAWTIAGGGGAKTAINGFQVKPQNASTTVGMKYDIYFDDIHFN